MKTPNVADENEPSTILTARIPFRESQEGLNI